MKKKFIAVNFVTLLFILFFAGAISAAGTDLDQPYTFEIQSKSDKSMGIQFIGNNMYHQNKYSGFGVKGKPMLSLRYMAQWFDFQVNYNPKSNTSTVGRGEYSFRVKPNAKLAEIYWGGEKINEYQLMEAPFIKNNALYLYSLDISALLGLMDYWDNDSRTWNVLYRDYTFQELGFPTLVNDDLLTVKGLMIDDGQHQMPSLKIMDISNNTYSYTGSIESKEFGTDGRHKYEIKSAINLNQNTKGLQISITLGERIIFFKEIDISVNFEAKELIVNPFYQSYQFTSPAKGYIKVSEPKVIIRGSVIGTDNEYPKEIVVLARKVDSTELMLQERIPIIDGQFNHELILANNEGLYKVTVCSIMAAPRGLAYPEITNFYVEYGKK